MNTAPYSTFSTAPDRRAAELAHARRRNGGRPGVIISTLVMLALLTGCGIRLEVAPPPALIPDANEVARQAMVSDVIAIQENAKAALTTIPADSPVAGVLTEIAATADAHLAALGGVYQSGITDPSEAAPSPGALPAEAPTALDPDSVTGADGTLDPTLAANDSPTPAQTAPADPSPETVLNLLDQSAARSRGAITTAPDPALARLFASITASELDSARALAAAAGIAPSTPEPFLTALPATLPKGLAAADLTTMVRSEDAAGYAYEVMAARSTDDNRAGALARAQVHRARAQTWAELASLNGAASDPREVAYDFPTAPDGSSVLADPQAMVDLGAQLENTLASSYATFTGQVDAENRPAMLDMLVDCRQAAMSWGDPLRPFPGLPEQS